jgi:hypothetical protein
MIQNVLNNSVNHTIILNITNTSVTCSQVQIQTLNELYILAIISVSLFMLAEALEDNMINISIPRPNLWKWFKFKHKIQPSIPNPSIQNLPRISQRPLVGTSLDN